MTTLCRQEREEINHRGTFDAHTVCLVEKILKKKRFFFSLFFFVWNATNGYLINNNNHRSKTDDLLGIENSKHGAYDIDHPASALWSRKTGLSRWGGSPVSIVSLLLILSGFDRRHFPARNRLALSESVYKPRGRAHIPSPPLQDEQWRPHGRHIAPAYSKYVSQRGASSS